MKNQQRPTFTINDYLTILGVCLVVVLLFCLAI